jgi:hypothetical protein
LLNAAEPFAKSRRFVEGFLPSTGVITGLAPVIPIRKAWRLNEITGTSPVLTKAHAAATNASVPSLCD